MGEAATNVIEWLLFTLKCYSDHEFLKREWQNNPLLSLDEVVERLSTDLRNFILEKERYPISNMQLIKLIEYRKALMDFYWNQPSFKKILEDPKWLELEKRAKELYESIQKKDQTNLSNCIKSDEDKSRVFELFLDLLDRDDRNNEALIFKILKILGCEPIKPEGVEGYQFRSASGLLGYQYIKEGSSEKVVVTFKETKPFIQYVKMH